MRRVFLYVFMVLLLTGISAAAGNKIGEIGSINPAGKEVIVNVKPGTDIKIGDRLQVETENGKLELEVTFPMQTVAKCRIKGKGKPASLNKGMTVSRFSKDDVNTDVKPDKNKSLTAKLGAVEKIGNVEMVYIKGGTFMMGSDTGNPDEKPVHQVTVDGFWIDKYEITQKQYQEIMGTNPSNSKGDNLPVEKVTWNNAMEFCKKFGEKYNVKVRLPYEAEWEYACRAGTTTKFYWGDELNGDYCWYLANSERKTHPVGEKKPNAFGLYDMIGNVNEWCMDWYSEKYYSESPTINPTGPAYGTYRSKRGGPFLGEEKDILLPSRTNSSPTDSGYGLGFRIVVTR